MATGQDKNETAVCGSSALVTAEFGKLPGDKEFFGNRLRVGK